LSNNALVQVLNLGQSALSNSGLKTTAGFLGCTGFFSTGFGTSLGFLFQNFETC